MKKAVWVKFVRAGLLSMALGLSGYGAARDVDIDPYGEYRDEVGRGEFDFDESLRAPWVESETEVLAVPDAANLRSVEVRYLPPGLELLADVSRISVDPGDRVIRLWLVTRANPDTWSGSYEGYRCETAEYKIYAYASSARTPPVRKVSRPVWRAVDAGGARSYRKQLLNDYFCPRLQVRDARQIRDALGENTGPHDFFSR